ncbi:hypothetical protein RhiirC2_767860 [Rhizophagus irregularis]|uniref:Uncharacterized protein n=1 Tax=Rhizophagus irregularis TaxID=588596 RepID=A0A2N1P343_9GLOM|nr:hypothetical protein RhiirC2_767860 [Rhizophagus irregularis]
MEDKPPLPDGQKVGNLALEVVKKDYSSQLQYLVQEFCRRVKIPFNGKESG